MRIAICDDELIYRVAICEAIEHWQKQHGVEAVLVRHYHSSEELLNDIESKQRYDMLFLDIQIPNEMDGIKLAKRIREMDECVQIVFFTNFAEYAYDGYYVNALRYLHKPVHPDQISECLDIAFRQWKYAHGENIVLEYNGGSLVLKYNSILYIEANGHMILIHCTDEKEPIRIRQRLSQLLTILPETIFVMCNRSYIVNIMYVRKITYDRVVIADGEDIAIGKRYRDGLKRAFNRYYQGL